MRKISRETVAMAFAFALLTGALSTGGALARTSSPTRTARSSRKSPFTAAQTSKIKSLISSGLKGKTGPAGPQGAPGGAGAKGDAGPAVAPRMHVVQNGPAIGIANDMNTKTDVIDTTLPTGDYAVSGAVIAQATSGSSANQAAIACDVLLNGSTVKSGLATTVTNYPVGTSEYEGSLNIPFSFELNVSSDNSPFKLKCGAKNAAPYGSDDAASVNGGGAEFTMVATSGS
ncbi:MAG: hypothetical protein QM648_07120 [Solirubrobacterales bacterium]